MVSFIMCILLTGYILPVSSYITSNNFNTIVRLIKNQTLSKGQRDQINNVLFKSYEAWAVKQAALFKKKHYYKCSKISLDELSNYSKTGLYKSIIKYNGTSDFNFFASLYINYEFKKALTDAYSLSILPRGIRASSKKNMTSENLTNYMNLLFIDCYSNVNHLYRQNQDLPHDSIDDYYIKHTLNKVWMFINNLPSFEKRIMHIKYDFFLKDVNSTYKVAQLMCCSQETIRKVLHKVQKKIKREFQLDIFYISIKNPDS